MESIKSIIEAVEAHPIDISGWLEEFPEPLRKFVLEVNYFWGLASFIDLYKIERVLEIGTCTGASAVVMCNAGAFVDTYDLHEDKWECNWPEKVKRCVVEDPSCIYELEFDSYDMIFVDIDHEGKEERAIHKKIIESGYQGLVFYDDIWLNKQMQYFWESIEQEKEWSLWHGPAGFGIVMYG